MTTHRRAISCWAIAIAIAGVAGCTKSIALESCPPGTEGDHCAQASGSATCGDGVCDATEVESCPEDCGSNGAGSDDGSGSDVAPPDGGGSATVSDPGTATYAVTSVTGFGMYCIDLPDAVFGQVGDTMTVDFESTGVYVNHGVVTAYDHKDFPVATTTTSNLGGSMDVTSGTYTSSSVFYFEDDQSSGSTGSTPDFYYSITMTRTGDALEIDFKIPNPEGDVTCLLQEQP